MEAKLTAVVWSVLTIEHMPQTDILQIYDLMGLSNIDDISTTYIINVFIPKLSNYIALSVGKCNGILILELQYLLSFEGTNSDG